MAANSPPCLVIDKEAEPLFRCGYVVGIGVDDVKPTIR